MIKREVPIVKLDLNFDGNRSVCMLEDCIPGAVPYHHTILKGSTLTFEPGSFHHILLTFVGDAEFSTDGNEYVFHERVCFIPHPDKECTVKAVTDLHILEIKWNKRLPEDDNLMAEYKTQYPVIQIYRNSKQYRDKNKSEKTISRSTIDQRRIPRFAYGSVETYGIDAVKSHDHPMLNQFFFSFPENQMDVLIDYLPYHMDGCCLMYIPLGSIHGVDIKEQEHCHYMWIDFYPDNNLALKRLDASHIATGKHVEFDEKTGERK